MKKFLASILAATVIAGAASAQAGTQLQTVSAQKGIQINGLKKIQISLKSESITIRQNEDTEDKTLNIEILSNYTAMYPVLKNDGKAIKIEQKDNTGKLKDRVCEVNITVPKDFKLQEIKINTESSDITIADFRTQKLEIGTKSGAVSLTKVESSDFSVSTEKGDLTVRDNKVEKTANMKSSSGSMTVTNLVADEIITETQKGNVRLSDITTKKISINADKGVLDLNMSKLFEKDSEIRVSSGNAKIYLPANSTFWTSGSVDRGRFRSEFSQDSKGPLLNIKVGGGDMQIIKGSGL